MSLSLISANTVTVNYTQSCIHVFTELFKGGTIVPYFL